MSEQLYCNIADVFKDLSVDGFRDVPDIVSTIRSASEWIERKLGTFIPITKTLGADGNGTAHLFVEPLLSITTLTHDGTSLATTQYILYPHGRHWEDGPYTQITVDPDATSLSVWKHERDVISIVGLFGKYNKSSLTGAVVRDNPLAADGATLLVDDAGLIYPGDSLLIGSEQIHVTDYSGSGTDSAVNISANVAVNDTVITIPSTATNPGEIIRIDNEDMYVVKEVGGVALHVIRAWGKTERAAHTSGADIFVYRTFKIDRAINGTTAAAHAQDVAISRYQAPAPVRYLAKQISALMYRKAQTGYAGKVADIEAGEIFYHNEFPKSIYQEIAKGYRC